MRATPAHEKIHDLENRVLSVFAAFATEDETELLQLTAQLITVTAVRVELSHDRIAELEHGIARRQRIAIRIEGL